MAAETLARNGTLGVWREPAYLPLSALTLESGQQGFRRVKAKLISVSERGGHWWLETEGQLVFRVSARYKGYFETYDLSSLEGKDVIGRGWLRERGGKKGGKQGGKHDGSADVKKSAAQEKFKPWIMDLKHPRELKILPVE